GLGAFLVRFHQDGGDDSRFAAGRVNVDLAKYVRDVLQLCHGECLAGVSLGAPSLPYYSRSGREIEGENRPQHRFAAPGCAGGSPSGSARRPAPASKATAAAATTVRTTTRAGSTPDSTRTGSGSRGSTPAARAGGSPARETPARAAVRTSGS